MFRYFNSIFENARIYTYNYLNDDKKIYKNLFDEHPIVDDKQLRIDILLFVRQYKNTYYKYTNKEKFNPELYNSFINEDNFDGGLTAFDDDETENVRIFDKYILEYIKNRSDVITFLQCKNKNIIMKSSPDELRMIESGNNNLDILFIIDMSEKDLFNYCYGIIKDERNISMIKPIIFSLIVKTKGELVRIRLSSFIKNKQNHPYLILESIIL
jgi:hypothetical protein